MTSRPVVATHSSRLEQHVPGVALVHDYRRSWLRPDLTAGLVLAAILVPQGMAYAELAGLPPVTGLYATIACLIGYAIMGPSRVLVLGPNSAVSPLILAATLPLLGAAKDPATAIALAGMLALLVGLIEIGLGVARLGFVADLLSKEVRVGYLNGLGVAIIAGQLPKLFGFATDTDGFLDQIGAFLSQLDETHVITAVLGGATLAVIFLVRRFARKVPAVLVAIVGSTVVSAVFDLSSHGVRTVGAFPQGLPKPDLPWTELSDVWPLLLAALGITIVSLTDTIATSASFAARRGEDVSPNQEMIGVGAANVAAGLFHGFAVSAGGSRTAVAEQAGAKSQVTGIVGAAGVVLLLLFLNSLLADLPQAALAAVVIAAATSLIDLAALRRFWMIRRSAFLVSVVAAAGVIFVGVLEGIAVAVGLTILLFFQRNWWPHGVVLARVSDGDWHAVADDDERAAQVPGVVALRWEAPLFFANAGTFRRRVRSLVRDKNARWVVLQCEAITDIDVTAAEMLEQLDNQLNEQGVHLAFVELLARLEGLMMRYSLFDALDRKHFYPSMDAAVCAIAAQESAGSDRREDSHE